MGLFRFGKKRDIIDLTERYKKQKEKEEQMASESASESSRQSSGPFAFFDMTQSTKQETHESPDVSDSAEKKRKLAKRIMEMTTKLEDLSNQIYHLQQRIEVLERKLNINIS